jgi:hypothetical protein
VAARKMAELVVFPGLHKWPIAGYVWACHMPWAKSTTKQEVFVAQEMEDLVPDSPCRVAGMILLG